MALQIANPGVVSKVTQLAKVTGLSKTAAVECAVDRLLHELERPTAQPASPPRLRALLAQMHRLPDLPDATDPLAWDEHGLPR